MGSLGLGFGAAHVHFEGAILPLPVLSSAPTVAGSGVETTSLLPDETDTWSHDGSPATVTAREYRLVLDGSVVVGPQSAAEIAIPDGTGGQSYSYELQVSIAEGGGLQSAWTLLATGIVSDALELSQTADGEVEIDHATGTVTVTITSPSWYANYDAGNGPGVFTFDSTLLASGPVNIIPPLIERTTDADSSGTTNEGDTVGIGDPASSTSYPGLWVYDPDVGGIVGAPSYQWQADAGGDGNFANLSGAMSSTYTLTGNEAGDDVRVQETLADSGGSRTVSSAAVSVEAATSATAYSALYQSDFASYGADDAWETDANIAVVRKNNNNIFFNVIAASDYLEGTLDNAWTRGVWGYVGTIAAAQKAVAVFDSQSGTDNNSMGLWVRASDGGTGISGYNMALAKHVPELRLFQFVDGVETTLETAYSLSSVFQGQRFELEIQVDGSGDHILIGRAELTSGAALTDVFTHNLGASPSLMSGKPGLEVNHANTGDAFRWSYVEFGEFSW